MPLMQKITPCLWFDDEAEQAAKFYTGIFKNSKIKKISRYGKEGYEIHHRPEGSVMTVEFELNGQAFTALNGGPVFKFNEAVSFQVDCTTQDEVDYYWETLGSRRRKAATVRLAQRQIWSVMADRSAHSGRHAQ
jgi:predicted 3-demethylubiquinone-9 3-methyltransferase (glyoxalase superfamily)